MSKKISLGILVTYICLSIALIIFYKTQVRSENTQNMFFSEKKLLPWSLPTAEMEPTPPVPTPASTTLLAVGDIMLDRSVLLKTRAANNWEHPFLLIDSLFREYDLHVANLEGPITNFTSVANGTGGARFTFTFSPRFVEPLKQRFEFLSLANNHAHNFGEKGLVQTRKFLDEAGVKYFGGPNNVAEQLVATSSHNGITFAWVGYHQLAEQGFANVIAEIKKVDKQVDVVMIFPHWGTEYVTDKPTPLQTTEAHQMVEAGADIILGAHPHVVQPIEIYKDRVIFYSLGNFIFDQYFSEDTMAGLAVGMKIEKTDKVRVEYALVPLDINKQSQPSVASAVKREKVLSALGKNSRVSGEAKIKIDEGKFDTTW